MRVVTDNNGVVWQVSTSGGFGVGGRALGTSLPVPEPRLVLFRSNNVEMGAPADRPVDDMRDAELLKLLEDAQDRQCARV